jgi:hypothetical protein
MGGSTNGPPSCLRHSPSATCPRHRPAARKQTYPIDLFAAELVYGGPTAGVLPIFLMVGLADIADLPNDHFARPFTENRGDDHGTRV